MQAPIIVIVVGRILVIWGLFQSMMIIIITIDVTLVINVIIIVAILFSIFLYL